MINKNELSKIQGVINSSNCVDCGKEHSVRISALERVQNQSHSAFNSSMVISLFPTGDKVCVEFSEDSCDAFKSRVLSYLQYCAPRFIDIPFDRIW